MQEGQLLDKVGQVSRVVAQKAAALKVPGVAATRTSGTSVWLETDSAATASKLVAHLRDHGVLVQRNGETCVTARPTLLFGESQASELFSALSKFQ